MRRYLVWLSFALTFAFGLVEAASEVEICSPGFPPSKVSKDGAVIEQWGTVSLRMVASQSPQVIEQRAEQVPMPMAVTCVMAGPVTLTQSAYRSPIWPSGVDVLEAKLCSTSEGEETVELELVIPESMELGESMGSIQGRPSLALPANLQPAREEREWGCLGGVRAMPGWAKPKSDCDPAFCNISAGMGGVPITYRFAVKPGAARTVVLGFCESFHPTSGTRPVMTMVEGAESRAIDPVDIWGQHVPGVIQFDARDVNNDGRLEITIAPHPQASDRNTILNVLWVFEPHLPIDQDQLLAGRLNERAERYVDVGGDQDQALYKPGNPKYVIVLAPREQREFFFLLASPGCQAVPDPSLGHWDQGSLRKAAVDVWRDRWK
jgi:hypothetical protein